MFSHTNVLQPRMMVAISRLILAAFAFVAAYADRAQVSDSDKLVLLLLAAYTLYAGFLTFALGYGNLVARPAIFVHALDVAVIGTLLHLTHGPISPYFIFFIFVLLSATLNWGWRGATATTAMVIAIYSLLLLSPEARLNQGRVIFRSAYLLVAGGLFCYWGALLSRERAMFQGLAQWPNSHHASSALPDFEPTLAHIAACSGVRRLMLLWTDRREEQLVCASYMDGTTGTTIVDEPAGPFGQWQLDDPVVLPRREAVMALGSMLEDLPGEIAVIAPVRAASSEGYFVMLTDAAPGPELLPIASIAALRIGTVLDEHEARRTLLAATAAESRRRVADDIHDGLLQSLTATGVYLKAIERGLPQDLGRDLAEFRADLAAQQDRLRRFVSDARAASSPPDAPVPVAVEVNELLAELDRRWNCRTVLNVEPPDAVVGPGIVESLKMFIAEAVANGVRHGGADRFAVDLRVTPNSIVLEIRDNGAGLAGDIGRFDHDTLAAENIGSASLRRRAETMKGRIEVASSRDGVAVRLEVPLR